VKFVTGEDQVYYQLARAAGVPFVDARSLSVSAGILRKIPVTMARSRRCVPLVFNQRRIVLVVDDPFISLATEPPAVLSELRLDDLRRVEFALAAPTPLGECIARWY
jgi:hypothetical protein